MELKESCIIIKTKLICVLIVPFMELKVYKDAPMIEAHLS